MSDKVKIVLVEDSPLDAELVLTTLTRAGVEHETLQVEDQLSYKQAIRTLGPDVILADYSLPRFNGVEAMLIKDEMCPDTPFIFVSGVMGEEIAIDCLKDGATDYVLKQRLERLPSAVKRAQREVAQRRAHEALNKRMRELTALNSDLEQFAYAASHDLQEPLRTISLYSRLLVRDHAAGLNKEGAEYLQFIESAAQHLMRLLEDLLVYAKLPSQMRDYDSVNLQEVLVETVRFCRAAIEETHATITHDDLPWVKGKAMQLSLVMQNLLSNALKYRGTKPPQIHISAARGTDSWLISVRDNGVGFEQEHAEHIFGLFKRLQQNGQPGTGLGLAICKRVIESHGGKIWAESKPNAGSTFYFSIPFRATDFDQSTAGAAVDRRAKAQHT